MKNSYEKVSGKDKIVVNNRKVKRTFNYVE
jgi:hypothetical protein